MREAEAEPSSPQGRATSHPISKGRAGWHPRARVLWTSRPGLAYLPLGLGQLEDLLPHGEESLALVLEANACGLHSLNAQLPLAPPMQELDMGLGGGAVRVADPHPCRNWTRRWCGEGGVLAAPAPPPPRPPAHLQGIDAGADVVVCLLAEGRQCARVGPHAPPQGDLQGSESVSVPPTPTLKPPPP